MTDTQFSEMVCQYERLVYSICYQLTRDHYTAQDLAQETFLSAYSHLASCPAENPKNWLARIATNKAKDHLKSAYHRRVAATANETLPEDGGALFMARENPEQTVVEKDTLRRVTEGMQALGEPYGKVALLYYIDEASVSEISQRLHRPYKTVQTQLYRARKLLQQNLAGEYACAAAG